KRHDVRSQIHPPHRDEREDDGDRQRDDRHQRGAHVPEKNNANERDHDAFFNQLFAQRRDSATDQLAAVVSWHDAHTGWQRRFDLVDFLLDTIDHVERVLAVTHHNDPANRLAFAVQFRDSAPDIAAKMHGAHVLHVNRCAFIDFQHNVFDIGDAFDVAAATHEIFRGRDLESLAAYVGVARFDRADDVAERDVVGDERVWIEIDLVLLHEATNRGDFRDAFHRLERVTKVPVLNRTQRRQIMFSAIVNQRVFVHPSYARGVGADRWVHALRQRAAHRIQIFNDARSRPINVGTVLEDDVNERFAEHRFAADELYFGRRDEDGGNWISDLVLDQIRRTSLPIRIDDHLDIAQVGNRIEWNFEQFVDAGRDAKDGENEDEKFVPCARFDQSLDHDCLRLLLLKIFERTLNF